MATISINEFQIIAGTGIEDYILLSYNGGQGGRIAVGTFKAQMTPSIKDGKWWIGGENTNVIAQGKDGKTPKFRGGANGIEYSYEGEESWSLLVPYSELRLKFEDLSEEQKAQLKMTLKDLSAEDIALLQKPAKDMIAVLESTNTQMQAAKGDAQDTADHPTYIGTDHYVYKWNKNAKGYDKTGIYVKGEQGIQGEKGEQGDRGLQGIQGEQGEKGEQGFTPVLEFGGVETLQPSDPASATFTPSGTDGTGNPKYRLDLSIPKGDKGENGNGSGNVLVDASGVVTGKQYVFTPSQNGSAEGDFVEFVQVDTSKLATIEYADQTFLSKSGGVLTGELRFNIPGIAHDDISTGIIAAIKAFRFQINEIISSVLYLGKSGEGDIPFTIKRYASVEDKNPSEDTTLVTVTPSGELIAVGGFKGNADSATKAMQDGNGNLITDTYASKITIVNHGTGDTTFALTPNVLHKWGEITSLTLSLEEYTGDDAAYYMAEFVSGSTATTLSVPDNIKWESDVTIEAGKTYQISILNNCGVIGGF